MNTRQQIEKHLTEYLKNLPNQTLFDRDDMLDVVKELEREAIIQFEFVERTSEFDTWIQAETGGNITIDGENTQFIGIIFAFEVNLSGLYTITDATQRIMNYDFTARKIIQKMK